MSSSAKQRESLPSPPWEFRKLPKELIDLKLFRVSLVGVDRYKARIMARHVAVSSSLKIHVNLTKPFCETYLAQARAGGLPQLSTTVTEAPAASKLSTTSTIPLAAARWRAVRPSASCLVEQKLLKSLSLHLDILVAKDG